MALVGQQCRVQRAERVWRVKLGWKIAHKSAMMEACVRLMRRGHRETHTDLHTDALSGCSKWHTETRGPHTADMQMMAACLAPYCQVMDRWRFDFPYNLRSMRDQFVGHCATLRALSLHWGPPGAKEEEQLRRWKKECRLAEPASLAPKQIKNKEHTQTYTDRHRQTPSKHSEHTNANT